MQHLEARLLDMVRQAKRVTLDNMNAPQKPALSEAETADAESFLADMLSTFPLLGLTVFEKTVVAKSSSRHEFKIEAKGIIASGYETPDGFIVLQGSKQFVVKFPRFITTFQTLEKIFNHKA